MSYNIIFTNDGVTATVREWARKKDIKVGTAIKRVKSGYTEFEDVFATKLNRKPRDHSNRNSLYLELVSLISEMTLNQVAIAKLLGTGQAQVSEMLSGRKNVFSAKRLEVMISKAKTFFMCHCL